MEQQFVELKDHLKMPIVGFGTWNSSKVPLELETALNEALEIGYRHIDTATLYKNENIVGNVLKKWLDSGRISRTDIFITSKLPPIGMKESLVSKFVDESLKRLQLDYIDLYLVHNPMGVHFHNMEDMFPLKQGKIDVDFNTDLNAVWRGMESQVTLGKVRAIGLSNCNSKMIMDVCQIATIKPANLQVELNLYLQQKGLRELCKKQNISLTAYAPLGTPKGKPFLVQLKVSEKEHPSLLEDQIVVELAKKYNKSPAQILLRFLIQLGISVIPKSTSPVRMRENIQILDFNLDHEDIQLLENQDKGSKGRRFDLSKFEGFEDHPLNPHKIHD